MKRKILRKKGNRFCEVEIELDNGRLSICGTEGRIVKRSGRLDVHGYTDDGRVMLTEACGQIVEEIKKWFPEVVPLLPWHLNDMKAGCEHQEAAGWDKRPIDPSKPLNAYGKHFPGQQSDSWNMLVWVRPDEFPGGLLTVPCPTCGYKYGSAWLKRELPPEIVKMAETVCSG